MERWTIRIIHEHSVYQLVLHSWRGVGRNVNLWYVWSLGGGGVYVYWGCRGHVPERTCGDQRTTFSFLHVTAGDWTQVIRLATGNQHHPRPSPALTTTLFTVWLSYFHQRLFSNIPDLKSPESLSFLIVFFFNLLLSLGQLPPVSLFLSLP